MPIPRRSRSFADLSRYAVALVGNAGSSGAQFLLSLVLVARLPAAGFGQFTFLLLLAQFIMAVAAALFAAPVASLQREPEPDGQDAWVALSGLQLVFVIPAAGVAMGAAMLVGADGRTAPVFALVVVLGCLRQFGRISQYSRSDQRGVALSDALFCLILLGGIALLLVAPTAQALLLAFASLSLAHALGIIPLAGQFSALGRSASGLGVKMGMLARYRSIWGQYSRWSLLGVISTEATANAHSYLVTLALGPGGYGAIAASAVLTRPGNVALIALGEFERARLGRLHALGGDLAGSRGLFIAAAAIVWLASAGLTAAVLVWFPDLLLERGYEPAAFTIAAWGWLAVLLARCAYLPASTEMQALGAFRELAWPTVIAMPVSIAGTVILLHYASPSWTLAAITLGQIVAGALILIRYRGLMTRAET
ncbi:hypothetical protein [Novosphingobium colocasiae]|uniref:hypothetical protein n=1 Tax=Novosphingobium colocasiae TaxID=1256513 RepID=UPI001676DDD6|nr:hypothetical protein [Novosphingobium colocasiae]